MSKTLVKGASIVSDGSIRNADVLIENDLIVRIDARIDEPCQEEINADGLHLLPGAIDDQVHFREPGLTHKADIASESRAAVAGGVTSFMEMPNTSPQATTQELLADKYAIAQANSRANFSFYMGATNDNLEEVLKTDPQNVCGIKIFMGSSTGNMLVDDYSTLESIFKNAPILIATHCEKEEIVQANTAFFKKKYGDEIPIECHPLIRSREACYASSQEAANLARKHDTRLHILHISTKEELELFENNTPIAEKRITSEACIHHLWFCDEDYATKGTHIKWNPAVKASEDRTAILNAVLDGTIDVIATDHAPHTLEEKDNSYLKAPSGGPLIQHGVLAMLELYHQGKISLEKIAYKMAHAPAILFDIKNRGYIKEGFKADLALVDLNAKTRVDKPSLLYKCGWSPFEGTTFNSSIVRTIVNGQTAYANGKVQDNIRGERLSFTRD